MKTKQIFASRNGFTFIELLVVMAIISILASLLLPALNRAKETTYSIVCKSSLRQRAVGMQLFLVDFGKYPRSLGEVKDHLGSQVAWDFCPMVERTTPLQTCCGPMSPYGEDYCYNSDGTGQSVGGYRSTSSLEKSNLKIALGLGGFKKRGSDGEWVSFQLPESRIQAPASMIAATHGVTGPWLEFSPLGFGGPAFYQHPYLNDGPLHKMGENALFCDGHVESENSKRIPRRIISGLRVSFIPDDAHTRRWNHDNQPHPETWPETD